MQRAAETARVDRSRAQRRQPNHGLAQPLDAD